MDAPSTSPPHSPSHYPPLLLDTDGLGVTESVRSFTLPTGTVSFLLTDVEGSTAAWERDPDAMSVAIARHYELLDEAISSAGGVRPVEQGEGDSVVGAFSRATDALAAAVAAQRKLTSEQWPNGIDLRVRMAIHTGEAQLRDEGNYFGQAIIRCARLRSCGHGGQVLVSQTVADLVADRMPPGVSLVDLGRHRLKDLHQPEQVWQVIADGLASEFEALRSLDAFRHNLPSSLTALIGREAELMELAATLAIERLVTLTGAGGCGKTRLAAELGAAVVDRFTGGVAWVELAPCADEAAIDHALSVVFNVAASGTALVERLTQALRSRGSTLLILDNAEHLLGPVADLVAGLLSRNEGLRVVITSREPLGLPGEVVWRVPSLTSPRFEPGIPVVPAVVSQFDAVRLFIDRAARARRGFSVTDANAPAVAQICSRLDGVPLAIELAAARVRTMSPERIAAQLDDRFRLLAGGSRTLLPRQQTLHASVAWSESLLDAPEQLAFRRLGVFMGGFTIGAAESVAASFGDVDAYEVADLVGRLVDKSLVAMSGEMSDGLGDQSGNERFELLETIRSYALGRLAETGELAAARDAHAEWCADWLEERHQPVENALSIEQFLAAGKALAKDIDVEWPNAVAALEWVPAGSDLSLRLCGPLGVYWIRRQMPGPVQRYGIPAVVAGDRTTPSWLAAMVGIRGISMNDRSAVYEELIPDAIALAEERGSHGAALFLSMTEGIWTVGPTDRNIDAYAQLYREASEHRSWQALGNGTVIPFNLLAQAGRLQDAAAIPIAAISSRRLVIDALLASLTGHFAESLELIGEADRLLAQSVPSVAERSLSALATARVAVWSCRDELNITYSVLDVTLASYPTAFQPSVPLLVALRQLSRGDDDDARITLSTAPDEGLYLETRNLTWRAPIEAAVGRFDEAAATAQSLIERSAHYRAPLFESTATLVLSDVARRTDPTTALTLAHEALVAAAAEGLHLATIDALEAIGSLMVEMDRPREGTRVLAAAHAFRDRTGYTYRFANRGAYVDSAHALTLDQPAWAEGLALSLDEVVELARRMRGERVRAVTGYAALTPTERQVTELVAEGLSNPQVAERLVMSRATVKTHLVHIFDKLGVANRTELAAIAIQRKQP